MEEKKGMKKKKKCICRQFSGAPNRYLSHPWGIHVGHTREFSNVMWKKKKERQERQIVHGQSLTVLCCFCSTSLSRQEKKTNKKSRCMLLSARQPLQEQQSKKKKKYINDNNNANNKTKWREALDRKNTVSFTVLLFWQTPERVTASRFVLCILLFIYFHTQFTSLFIFYIIFIYSKLKKCLNIFFHKVTYTNIIM